MTITALPTPPSRENPATFSPRTDAFLGALPTFATEANALASAVNAAAGTATTQAGIATTQAGIATAKAVESSASAEAAAASSGATKWISGTTYADGFVAWSPVNYLAYRRKTNGAGTTDPSADATNWATLNDVTKAGAETLANKTLGTGTVFTSDALAQLHATALSF